MAIDVQRARRETPGCGNVLHFNNAGAALMPQAVLHATIGHLQLEALIGGYEAAAQAHEAVEQVYDAAARLLGCQREEIAIVENATRAWDMAFYAIPLGPGDRILTAVAEYASNFIAFLQRARQTGAVVEVIPNEASGQLSIEALRQAIDARVKLIAITHVPTNGGLVNPAAAVGQVAREAGVWYLLDACQSIGQLPLDVEALGCDLLSATGRKFLFLGSGSCLFFVWV
jgi:cysteine desulfurase/selenocysteine lyase